MLEREICCILYVIHIVGTRMKRAGIDVMSRNDSLESMLSGRNPLDCIPLNKGAGAGANERVEEWVQPWWIEAAGDA